MKREGRDAGFTLIELLTVLAIVSVLMGLVVGVLGHVREKARRADVLNLLKGIENGAKQFQLAYSRWPWEVEGQTLARKLNAGDIFAELSPGNDSLAPASYKPLVNTQRVEYLAIAPKWIKSGKVVDPWGGEIEIFWNPGTSSAVIVAPANNGVNDSVDTSGARLRESGRQQDDINNL